MSTADLKAVATGAPAADKPKDFPAMLNAWLPEIRRALPKHLNGDRMARIALTAFRRTPKLAECDPRSVFAAVIQASQLGLEPDTLGRSYLIPYQQKKKTASGQWKTTMECQFVPGWKGLVDLMNRSGQGTVYTGVIFKDQEYRYRDGSERKLDVLNETSLANSEDITHAFAVGYIKGGMFPVIELWRMAKVLKHRDRYNKVGDKHYSFTHLEMYARKVVLLQVLKYMPCSPELATAMALNDDAEIGAQHIDLKDAIEGTWEPAADDDDSQTSSGGDNSDTGTETGSASGAAAEGGRDAGAKRGSGKPTTASGPTVAEIGESIKNAKSMDDLNVARDLIRYAPDEFRAGLEADAAAKAEKLATKE